jgi:DNA-binding IclR family transcriptional regulator
VLVLLEQDARRSTADPRSGLSTVAHAIQVLEQFTADDPVLGTSELARRMGLPKSSVHRLVSTLAAHGFLRRGEDGRYLLGMHLYELGSLIPLSLELRPVALPYIRRLMQAAQETVHLGVRDGREVVYIDKFETTDPMHMYSRPGRRAPMHCTGIGKAILAYEPEEVVDDVVAAGLPSFTARTITDGRQLRTELELVRASGHAFDREEIEAGLRCVAAPVFDYNGRVVAAISVAGPSTRMTYSKVLRLTPIVSDTALAVSEGLGYRPGYRTSLEARRR